MCLSLPFSFCTPSSLSHRPPSTTSTPHRSFPRFPHSRQPPPPCKPPMSHVSPAPPPLAHDHVRHAPDHRPSSPRPPPSPLASLPSTPPPTPALPSPSTLMGVLLTRNAGPNALPAPRLLGVVAISDHSSAATPWPVVVILIMVDTTPPGHHPAATSGCPF